MHQPTEFNFCLDSGTPVGGPPGKSLNSLPPRFHSSESSPENADGKNSDSKNAKGKTPKAKADCAKPKKTPKKTNKPKQARRKKNMRKVMRQAVMMIMLPWVVEMIVMMKGMMNRLMVWMNYWQWMVARKGSVGSHGNRQQPSHLERNPKRTMMESEGRSSLQYPHHIGGYHKVVLVTLPSADNFLGSSACENCRHLSQVDLSDTMIKVIHEHAFSQCKELTHTWLPSTLREIHMEAFAYCEILQEVEIPPTLRYIAHRAFTMAPNGSLRTKSQPFFVTKSFLPKS